MKIKFLNKTIMIEQSNSILPYPFYDVNYHYSTIYVSAHVNMKANVDRELLNNIILQGCIDITRHNYCGMGSNGDPVYDFLLSRVDILNDVYDYKENNKEFVYMEVKENGKRSTKRTSE